MHPLTQPADSWLNTHLFRLDEGWRGSVRLLSFLGNGYITQSIPACAQFGDDIQLDSVEILDSVSVPDGVVRLRLIWHAQSPIKQLLVTCANLMDAFSGRVVAQHYGQPVGDSRPTNTWRRGEVILDQFALRVFADTPPGSYQLRLGLYDLDTQARLRVSWAESGFGDSYIGGLITVR